jgi:hypothetical protein
MNSPEIPDGRRIILVESSTIPPVIKILFMIFPSLDGVLKMVLIIGPSGISGEFILVSKVFFVSLEVLIILLSRLIVPGPSLLIRGPMIPDITLLQLRNSRNHQYQDQLPPRKRRVPAELRRLTSHFVER